MIEQDRDGEKVLPLSPRADRDEALGYEIVLACGGGEREGERGERLLAKAASNRLAQAIFNAAKAEHPGRRIVLRRDTRVIVDSANEKTS
jgi:hypothetical protein